jgi:hypothetical protein
MSHCQGLELFIRHLPPGDSAVTGCLQAPDTVSKRRDNEMEETMNEEAQLLRPRTLYISRVAFVPAERAAPLLAAALAEVAHPNARGLELPLGRWSLEIAAEDAPLEPPRSAASPVWMRPGRLRARSMWFPVELEVVRWSDRASELALRPAWRRRPAGAGMAGYLAAGGRALDTLRFEVELRDVLGGAPAAA